jgi:methylenetetrahydrofolate dehydrogenase (NADP+)/methenyltetrahydrofolate cyclohydrolase
MIVDGRALAEERKEEIRKERGRFGALSLGVVMAGESPVTQSYVGIKKRVAESLGISVQEYRLPDTSTTEEIITEVERAVAGGHDGIILQLPLPSGVDVEAAKNIIPLVLDVDVLSDAAFDAFARNDFPAIPPVPAAMWYILKRNSIPLLGANLAIIGRGRLVGKPAEVLFKRLGANVTVLRRGDDIASVARDADIIISGAGVPGLLTSDMVKKGVVIIDGGTSESSGKVVGDADLACVEKASVFTPVPGGVGPVAVVEIFANLVNLKKDG